MAVQLEHPFTMTKPIDGSFATITDLEQVVPCVEGGRVLERTGEESVRAEIVVRMGAMSLHLHRHGRIDREGPGGAPR